MVRDEFHTVRGYELIGHNSKLLTSAMEDYLEMIYRYTLEEESIRVSQIAELLHVKAPSVTIMMQRLGELGLIKYEKYGKVTLTEHGRELGRAFVKRHEIIYNFLKFLNCKEDILVQTELIEHNISADTVKSICSLLDFFDSNPDALTKFRNSASFL